MKAYVSNLKNASKKVKEMEVCLSRINGDILNLPQEVTNLEKQARGLVSIAALREIKSYLKDSMKFSRKFPLATNSGLKNEEVLRELQSISGRERSLDSLTKKFEIIIQNIKKFNDAKNEVISLVESIKLTKDEEFNKKVSECVILAKQLDVNSQVTDFISLRGKIDVLQTICQFLKLN